MVAVAAASRPTLKDMKAYNVELLALASALAIACSHPKPIPKTPKRWLTDTVNYLSPKQAEAIDLQLQLYEMRTKHQVFVWIGDTTKGEPHQDFAFRVFNAWGIGREGHDDGIMLWIWTKDNMRWITVGYGLEKAMSDREAVRICREVIKPLMEAGKPDDALTFGVQAILLRLDEAEAK